MLHIHVTLASTPRGVFLRDDQFPIAPSYVRLDSLPFMEIENNDLLTKSADFKEQNSRQIDKIIPSPTFQKKPLTPIPWSLDTTDIG